MQSKWKWILAAQEQVLDFGLVLRSISVWDQGSVGRDELSWDETSTICGQDVPNSNWLKNSGSKSATYKNGHLGPELATFRL